MGDEVIIKFFKNVVKFPPKYKMQGHISHMCYSLVDYNPGLKISSLIPELTRKKLRLVFA